MAVHLTAAVFMFLALSLVTLRVVLAAKRPVESRIRALAAAQQGRAGLAAIPFEQRVVLPLIESAGRLVAAVLPGAFLRRTEKRLVLAGNPLRPATLYALMLTVGSLMAGGYVLLVIAISDGTPQLAALLPGVGFGLVGAYSPVFWSSSQAQARQKAMIKGLPDSFDLLTICVEAGLGLDAAFHRVAEKQSGPFVDEIRQMLREIGLGKSRRDGLLDLADRTQLDDVRTFGNAVIQAEQLGTSLAQVLRVQSQRMRVRRRQRAEQEARRVPVKMVFPLVFCLMPSLFIFIIGPIVVNAINYLTSN